MLDESGFGADTEMGGFVLYKFPELYLVSESFWRFIFTSSASVRSTYKRSVSNTFVPSDSLNTKPPTILLLLLQYLQIYFSVSFDAWIQYQQGGLVINRGVRGWKLGGGGMYSICPRIRRGQFNDKIECSEIPFRSNFLPP